MPQIIYFELPSKDPDRASGFWSGLFGWKIGATSMPEMDYRMFQATDEQGGAVYADEERAGTGPFVYFDTPDIDASIVRVRELGGQASDKQPVAGYGWFSASRDTEGNGFFLWQSDENAA